MQGGRKEGGGDLLQTASCVTALLQEARGVWVPDSDCGPSQERGVLRRQSKVVIVTVGGGKLQGRGREGGGAQALALAELLPIFSTLPVAAASAAGFWVLRQEGGGKGDPTRRGGEDEEV